MTDTLGAPAGLLLFDEPAGSQAERAYRGLLEEIVSLRLAPGEVLVEERLCELLGLGRTPVREALQRLAAQRLVVIIPRRGVMVSEINITDLREIYQVRAPLEGQAAALAAERWSGRELPSGVTADLAAMSAAPDFFALVAVDHRLHHAIHQMAGNSYLLTTLDWLLTLSIRLVTAAGQRLPAQPADELAETMRDFRDQFAAITAGDAAEAERLARRHAGFSEELLRRVV
jgi:DNA-binding GntR family transcriptional regulator